MPRRSRRDVVAASRRRFLQFVAGSPLFALPGVAGHAADGPQPRPKFSDPMIWAPLNPQ